MHVILITTFYEQLFSPEQYQTHGLIISIPFSDWKKLERSTFEEMKFMDQLFL
jgi:hypothetical protein